MHDAECLQYSVKIEAAAAQPVDARFGQNGLGGFIPSS
jgi:hypothetical protein